MPATKPFRAFRDGDCYIIGRSEDQRCLSTTHGYATAYSKQEAAELVAKFHKVPPKCPLKRYSTDDRFESGCDQGLFGPEWDW